MTPGQAERSKVADALQPGSVWKGTWTFEDPIAPGGEASYKLVVTERSGNHFVAESLAGNAQIQTRVDGTIRGDQV